MEKISAKIVIILLFSFLYTVLIFSQNRINLGKKYEIEYFLKSKPDLTWSSESEWKEYESTKKRIIDYGHEGIDIMRYIFYNGKNPYISLRAFMSLDLYKSKYAGKTILEIMKYVLDNRPKYQMWDGYLYGGLGMLANYPWKDTKEMALRYLYSETFDEVAIEALKNFNDLPTAEILFDKARKLLLNSTYGSLMYGPRFRKCIEYSFKIKIRILNEKLKNIEGKQQRDAIDNEIRIYYDRIQQIDSISSRAKFIRQMLQECKIKRKIEKDNGK